MTEIKWAGGRLFEAEDMRTLPGKLAFVLTADDGSIEQRIWKGTELEAEIAALVDS